ncbi:MAG: type II toxin-antitoxin system prevent-host-death family antitoxin [Clostridia bacterium]|nr:type II toxin-antitoxin system prevent-host-death family antitoxin [Clostridia bacterium]
MMVVKSTEVQNNFGKYLEMASGQEIVITKNGIPVARLLGMQDTLSFLADRLVGILPKNMDEDEAKAERLNRQ